MKQVIEREFWWCEGDGKDNGQPILDGLIMKVIGQVAKSQLIESQFA